jgi:7,8-dihydroneopterin aldolase/epimerase/oxygenase
MAGFGGARPPPALGQGRGVDVPDRGARLGRVSCSIGIYAHERQRPQRVRISVDLDVVDPGSFATDDFATVLNYEFVVEGVQRLLAKGHIDLVETLAERVAALCLEDPRATRATVTVEKLDIYPQSEGVGVSIVRGRATHADAIA